MNQSINFPTLKQIEQGLYNLKKVNWDTLSIEKVDDCIAQIEHYLLNTFGLFSRNLNISSTEILNNSLHNYQKVFRLRTFSTNINEELISEFSNPPVMATRKLGRAN